MPGAAAQPLNEVMPVEELSNMSAGAPPGDPAILITGPS